MRMHELMKLHGGVVRVNRYPHQRSAWSRLVVSGELFAPLPGVVMDPALKDDPMAWIQAIHLWNPNAVIAGTAAARLSFVPEADLSTIRVLTSTRLSDRGPIRFRRCAVAASLVGWVGDLRVTGVDLTSLTAALDGDFEPVTDGLREGLTTRGRLAEAARHWPVRPRGPLEAVLKAVERNPWSVAEVDAHRLFRESGLTGWVGNPTVLIDGVVSYPDIAFLEPRIAFEINSFAHHSSRSDMERDSSRMNRLIAAGWRVYTLTPAQVRYARAETGAFIRSVVPREFRRGKLGPDR